MSVVRARYIGVAIAAVSAVLLMLATWPPTMPSHARVVAAFRPSEAWLYDRHGTLIDSQRVDFHARRLAWVPLARIAPVVRTAVVSAEDKRFRDHGGVDLLALANAIWARVTGDRSRGASTISMQVAALLVPDLARPGKRCWRDKLRQMRSACALEDRWSKDQILEAYLNLADYRGEASGIGAAASTLFGKPPDALSRHEATLLAAVLPAPAASVTAIAARACRLAPTDCPRLRSLAGTALSSERQAAGGTRPRPRAAPRRAC